ncbi:hypothetical protein [Kineosporia sp. NBRC 101731]|uniref:hypothetical protein n=1 Tax=Kineosporia sp. NBRC 101731 TaxID=3032199 RepID=UPI0025563D08|nr:hypothetical protein [Kineosporia sp. NBRC 101731]
MRWSQPISDCWGAGFFQLLCTCPRHQGPDQGLQVDARPDRKDRRAGRRGQHHDARHLSDDLVGAAVQPLSGGAVQVHGQLIGTIRTARHGRDLQAPRTEFTVQLLCRQDRG